MALTHPWVHIPSRWVELTLRNENHFFFYFGSFLLISLNLSKTNISD